MKKQLYAIGIIVAGTLAGCVYNSEEELYGVTPQPDGCDTTSITFTADVVPILQQKCLSCHNADARTGGVNLQGHAQVQSYAQSGLLYGVITHAPGFTRMPPSGVKLDDCEIATIKAWIDAGTPNN